MLIKNAKKCTLDLTKSSLYLPSIFNFYLQFMRSSSQCTRLKKKEETFRAPNQLIQYYSLQLCNFNISFILN